MGDKQGHEFRGNQYKQLGDLKPGDVVRDGRFEKGGPKKFTR